MDTDTPPTDGALIEPLWASTVGEIIRQKIPFKRVA
jgi:hypothetical protein